MRPPPSCGLPWEPDDGRHLRWHNPSGRTYTTRYIIQSGQVQSAVVPPFKPQNSVFSGSMPRILE